MARKPSNSASSSKKTPAPKVSTTVRNSPVPKTVKAAAPAPAPAARKVITHDDIARRAYEIWASGKGGSEHENWLRAERELKGL